MEAVGLEYLETDYGSVGGSGRREVKCWLFLVFTVS